MLLSNTMTMNGSGGGLTMMSARQAVLVRQPLALNSIWSGKGRDGLMSAFSTVRDGVITAMCKPSPMAPRRISPVLLAIGWRLVKA